MIYLTILLILVGGVLLIAEAFTPGFGVFGISGLVATIASAVITIIYVPFGPFIVLGEFALLGTALFMFLNYIKKKQLYGKIVLDETLNMDEKEIGDLSYFLGKEGVAKTPLKPIGNVDFNGVVLEVYSNGEFISEKSK